MWPLSNQNLLVRDRFVNNCDASDRELISLQLRADGIGNKLIVPKANSSLSSGNFDDTCNSTNHISQLYLSRLKNQVLIGQNSVKRSVPAGPERILDAPGLVDDFYLNVLDWSARNIIAVALGPAVYLWSGADGSVKEMLMLMGEGDYVSSLAWIQDAKSLAVGTSDGCTQIWDAEKGRKLRTMVTTPGRRVSALAWNRHLLTTGSRNGSVFTHDVRVAKHLVTTHITRGTHEVCGLAWSPDGRYLVSGTNDNLIHLWEAGLTASSHVLEGHRSAVKALSWCPWHNNILASGGGSQDRTIRMWNVLSGECLETVDSGSQVSSLLWSRTSRELISAHGHDRNHLAIWSVGSSALGLEQTATIENAHDTRILHMTLSPDGRTIATASSDESIKFWPLFNTNNHLDGKKNSFSKFSSQQNSSPFSLRTKSFR